jgi:hypothetical protein
MNTASRDIYLGLITSSAKVFTDANLSMESLRATTTYLSSEAGAAFLMMKLKYIRNLG